MLRLHFRSFYTDIPLDTAQSYGNESEAGAAIRQSGLKREQIFITTKFSGSAGKDVEDSINDSLKNVSFKELVTSSDLD